MANYWNTVQNWQIQEQEPRSESDDSHTPSPVYEVLKEMGTHMQKEDPFDKVINEFLHCMYPDMVEQEFQVCRSVVWAVWDLERSHPPYENVVSYLLGPQSENRRDLFLTIKDIEETVSRLISKGILSQDIGRIGTLDKDGNIHWRFDQPFIALFFSKDQGEVMRAIDETFSQDEIGAFFGLHTNYDI
jgi:hypothetical protein